MDELVQKNIQHPLIVIRFRIDQDLAMVFHATENAQGQLQGVSLTPVRVSKGVNFIRLHPDLIHKVFCPVITAGKENEWTLEIRPLDHVIQIQKRKSGKYVCLYPFPEQGRSGQLVDVWVDGNPPPNAKMWFTVNATYQASKDAQKQTIQAVVQCPSQFTQELLGIAEQ